MTLILFQFSINLKRWANLKERPKKELTLIPSLNWKDSVLAILIPPFRKKIMKVKRKVIEILLKR